MGENGLLEPLNARESGKFIAGSSKYVSISKEEVMNAANKILPLMKAKSFSAAIYSAHPLHPKPVEASVQWIFLVDCLNFSFWTEASDKFAVEFKGQTYTGYYSLCAAITKAIHNGINLMDADFCSTISPETVGTIFQSASSTVLPLLEKGVEIIREYGKVLTSKFDGSFLNAVKAADKDALKLVKLIHENFPCFRDFGVFHGVEVSFLKRAQIVVADIYGCFDGKSFGEFHNIDKLTTFADYRVPQCLLYFDILKYSPELNSILQSMISPGSVEEMEIRGNTIHAVELLVEQIRELALKTPDVYGDITINAVVIDFFLWEYAREYREEVGKLAFHKVRTHFY
jgi:hypothetical protein